ncbi:MAG: amino acid adenylation domain-containing protein, partial [Chloroflexota bacterium]
LILTQSSLMPTLANYNGQPLYLDQKILWRNQATSNPEIPFIPSQLSHIVYTSGSTGRPKGILSHHQGVVNFIHGLIDNYGLSSSDVVLQLPTISFDASIRDMIAPLFTGATVVLVNQHIAKDPVSLLPYLEKYQITRLLSVVPTMLNGLVAATAKKQIVTPSLKTVLTSGEALKLSLCQQAQAAFGDQVQIVNQYGPTECTMTTTRYSVPKQIDATKGFAKIGKPTQNYQVYILDRALNPVPIGVTGHLYIGGVGLAWGYLNQAALTATQFIPHPFSKDPGQRLYKTGDLARYEPDGTLEFLGRLDHQIKRWGVRIELNEIEAVLVEHLQIAQAVVVTRGEGSDQALIAYLVLGKDTAENNQESDLLHTALKASLKAKLPASMIPTDFVYIDAIPLTPNGKIDRLALPEPTSTQRAKRLTTPRDALEFQLAELWSEVLRLDEVGIDDNFFELGGHSLLAVRLMSAIEQKFGQLLPLATLFQAPTIAQLSQLLQETSDNVLWSSLVPIQTQGTKSPFFCLPGSGGNVIYLHHLARHLGQDQPFYGLQAVGLDGITPPHTQVEEMAAHYIQMIQTVQPEGPYFLGGHSFGGTVAFEITQQLQQQGHKIGLLALFDSAAPTEDLNQGDYQDWDDAHWLAFIAEVIGEMYGYDLQISVEMLEGLTFDEQLDQLLQISNQVPESPLGATKKQLEGFIAVFKANVSRYYIPQNIQPATTINLFKAEDVYQQLGANRLLSTLGWDQFVNEDRLKIHKVSGNHMTMMTDPHIEQLAKQLAACIEAAKQQLNH